MAVYGGQRGGLASRMGTYDSEAGSSNNMFGLNEQGKENVANFTGNIKDKIKGALTKASDAYGDAKSQGYIGKHKGIDFLHGAPTMKDVGQGIGTAYGNVRKFFGDRLNAMKQQPQEASVPPTVSSSFTGQGQGTHDTTVQGQNKVFGKDTVSYDPQMFYSMKNPNTTMENFTKEQVPGLQQFLKSENLYEGEVDGIAGPQTISAWNKFTGAS
tara:strand:- start:3377 stop:4015 length:639 start_codon:yes stop_codon:yes gene_type:complete